MRGLLILVLLVVALPAFADDNAAPQPGPAPVEASSARVLAPPPAVSVPSNDYPRISVILGEQGRVGVRYLVRADGTVGDVLITKSSGSPRLDAAATRLVHRWIFKPALRDGAPVAVWIDGVVVFKLR